MTRDEAIARREFWFAITEMMPDVADAGNCFDSIWLSHVEELQIVRTPVLPTHTPTLIELFDKAFAAQHNEEER